MEEKKETPATAAPAPAKETMEIPVAFAQELINYMQARPYAEVFQLINKLVGFAKQGN